jgi:hypothetical protein
VAKASKFGGVTSRVVFRRQFERVAENNCQTRQEKSTYLITAWQRRATDVLHAVPKDATYEETFDALEG